MKKISKIITTTLLGFVLFGCKPDNKDEDLILTPIENVNVPYFEFTINNIKVDKNFLKDYTIYKYDVTSTNSEGNTSTTTYIGYRLIDAVNAINYEINETYVIAKSNDGYSVTYNKPQSKNIMMAFNKNNKDVENYPIFAPCESNISGDYLKQCSTILFTNETDSPQEDNPGELEEPTIKKKNDIEFSPFSFKVNNQNITNDTLSSLDKYKANVQVKKQNNSIVDHSYTGYLLKDILNLLNVSTEKLIVVDNENNETVIEKNIIEDNLTLLAIECDKKTGENGTVWIAPCSSHVSGDYIKLVTEIKTPIE